MKPLVFIICSVFYVANLYAQKNTAQEPKFVGTWTGTYRNAFTDYEDRKIVVRIDKVDGEWQVRVKDYNPKDTSDCTYREGIYEIEQNGSVLQWYQKTNFKISQEQKEMFYGANFGETKRYARVKYSGGVLFYTDNYWVSGKFYTNDGQLVHAYDEKNEFRQFITETVLYKEDKW